MVNLVAIQLTSSPNVAENLAQVEYQLSQLDTSQPTLVTLPECVACFPDKDGQLLSIAESLGHGPIQDAFRAMAKRYNCYLVAGTVPLKTQSDSHFSASSLLISPEGDILAEYQKIHLFDVSVADSTKHYLESKYTKAGESVVTVETPIGKIGMSVCYDVRFSGLYGAMGDVDIIVVPAAFTKVTGEAHWHTLLRARAIEKQAYVVGANQSGLHDNNRETFGHSLIYSPWGKKLAELPENAGSCSAQVSIDERKALQQRMPVQQHNQFRSSFVKSS